MMNDDDYFQGLLNMLKSDNAGIRFNACRFLKEATTIPPMAIDALQNALKDSDSYVAAEAKKALAVHLSPTKSQESPSIQPPPTLSQKMMNNIQKWEHHWEFVFLDEGEYVLLVGNRKLTGKNVWNHLASLGKDGWELVSIAPQIGDTNPAKRDKATMFMNAFDLAMAGPRLTPLTQHKTGTTGYFFWYKRPLATIQCPTCKAVFLSDSLFCTICGSKLNV
jgi:hypothetical protein